MARRRRRRYGELTHRRITHLSPSTVRRFGIAVNINREPMFGKFYARACIPKGSMNLTNAAEEKWRYRRLSPRCGSATASTPTKALRGALAKLTRSTR